MNAKMFSRQVSLLGKDNQNLIENSKITIVGLGALGSAVAHLLVRMGVKNLVLVDGDIVANHNLSRQHLYVQKDLGNKKVLAAKKHLEEINPFVKIETFDLMITKIDDLECVNGSTIIVDGLDNHKSRRLIDAYCKKNNINWVHGAAIEEKGMVFFFDNKTSYDQIYPLNASDTHCSISGVLATTTTLVATIQAQLVLNFLIGRKIAKELIRVDVSKASIEKFKIK
jgi:adenylyltransferase/sulfurtransferase